MPDAGIEADDLSADYFLGGRLSILQPTVGYRAGLDAVLLAAAATATPGARVLDAGAGVGVVGLAIATRVADTRVTLVEIEPSLATLARENARRNGLADRVTVVEADIAAGGGLLHGPDCPPELGPARFEHLVTNPPFYARGSGTPSPTARKTGAHQMAPGAFDRWIAFLATAGTAGATLTLIHRADALGAILAALDGRFGRVRIRPVHPREGAPAGRVLVSGAKGSRAPLEIGPGLVLQEADGRYRAEIDDILRGGGALV